MDVESGEGLRIVACILGRRWVTNRCFANFFEVLFWWVTACAALVSARFIMYIGKTRADLAVASHNAPSCWLICLFGMFFWWVTAYAALGFTRFITCIGETGANCAVTSQDALRISCWLTHHFWVFTSFFLLLQEHALLSMTSSTNLFIALLIPGTVTSWEFTALII